MELDLYQIGKDSFERVDNSMKFVSDFSSQKIKKEYKILIEDLYNRYGDGVFTGFYFALSKKLTESYMNFNKYGDLGRYSFLEEEFKMNYKNITGNDFGEF